MLDTVGDIKWTGNAKGCKNEKKAIEMNSEALSGITITESAASCALE